MNINQIILELRKERNISQQKLADSIGVSQSTIAKIEIGRNEATASTIKKLADFFHVSADYIIGVEENYTSMAKSIKSPAPTEEERELLSLFGKMTHAQKVRFVAYGEGLIGAPIPQRKA